MKTLLIVEDDSDIRLALAEILTYEGYSVIETGNGFEALELLKTKKVNLCLIDIMMPDMDGIELTQKLKSDSLTSPIPVILMSAGQKQNFSHLGACAFIRKPVSVEDLLSCIEKNL